jgi:hypothetical protein
MKRNPNAVFEQTDLKKFLKKKKIIKNIYNIKYLILSVLVKYATLYYKIKIFIYSDNFKYFILYIIFMEILTVRIEKDLLEKLEGYAKIKGYNRSALVRRALYEFLKKMEVS